MFINKFNIQFFFKRYSIYFYVFFFFILCFFLNNFGLLAEEILETNNFIADLQKSNFDRHAYPLVKIYKYDLNIYVINSELVNDFLKNLNYRLEFSGYVLKSIFNNYFFFSDLTALRRSTVSSFDFYSYMIYKNKNHYINLNITNIPMFVEDTFSFKLILKVYSNNVVYDNINLVLNFFYTTKISELEPFGSNFFFFNDINFLFYKFKNDLLDIFCISFFSFIVWFFFIFFYTFLFLFVVLYFYSYKKFSFLGFFDVYLSEEDDDVLGYFDYLRLFDELDRVNKYYNILKFESFYLSFINLYNKNFFLWYNISDKNSLSYSQFENLTFGLNRIFLSKIEVYPWIVDDISTEDESWAFFPYDMISFAFPESKVYFKIFNRIGIEIDDIAYDSIVSQNSDVFGILTYDFVLHPVQTDDFIEQKEVYNINSSKFKPDIFFKKVGNNSDILERFQFRYIKIMNRALKKLEFIDFSVNYFDIYDNKFDLDLKTSESGLNVFFSEWRLYENNLSFFAFYDDEVEEYEGYIDPIDLRYKIVPSVWRHFSLINFFSIVVQSSLGHFFIRNSVFWEDYGHSPDSDTLEEDRYLLEKDFHLSGLFKDTNFSSFFGFGLDKKRNYEVLNFGSNSNFFNLEAKNLNFYIKYPPIESFIGYFLVPPEYRLLKGMNTVTQLSLIESLDLKLYKSNLIFNSELNLRYSNDFLIENTFFIGLNNYPDGLTFATSFIAESLFNNSYTFSKDSVELLDDENAGSSYNYEIVEDIIEVLFLGFAIPSLFFTVLLLF